MDQYNEIGGFDFANVPEIASVPCIISNDIVPLVYHASSRIDRLPVKLVALRLADLINFRTKSLRFSSRAELRDAFRIRGDSEIILSGVDQDHRIEPWWALGEARRSILALLQSLDIKLATTPNFSLILDRPRTDDLHSLKRILITHQEMTHAGIAAALHINGRTDRDFERWGELVAEREAITAIAYEFSSGSGRNHRRQLHADWLCSVAEKAGKPLDLIVRGDPKCLPLLLGSFRAITYIETTSFIRSIKRRKARRVGNRRLIWDRHPTEVGTPIDQLIEHNVEEQRAWLTTNFFGSPPGPGFQSAA